MSNESERMRVLQMIEDGAITAEEGMRLLNALAGKQSEGESQSPPPAEPPRPAPFAPPPNPKVESWKRWWVWPMAVGIGVTFFGALLMYWAYSAVGGLSFWFFCASPPFVFGVLLMALAAASRTAKWIHIRVNTGQDEWPRRISISLPLPIGLTAWLLRIFRDRLPQFKDTAVDELILALGEGTSAENPLYVEVNEGEEGEKVQVYIG
jgi:hypothetical protein